MNLIALTLTAFVLLHYTVSSADSECGKVEYRQLYHENFNPELEDFPWIARMFPVEMGLEFQCNAVLITKRHLLAPAHCIELGARNIYFDVPENETHMTVPESVYKVIQHIIHPNYSKSKKLNDISIFTLDRDVNFTDYIQPICLPPPSASTTELNTQYLQLVGYHNRVRDFKRFRSVAHIIPPEECLKDYYPDQNLENTLCASIVGENVFSSGSALMGVNIENRANKTYYLLGLSSFGQLYDVKSQRYVFVRIPSFLNWIQTNIQFSLNFPIELQDD